jgi:6-phosphofructokinase 1
MQDLCLIPEVPFYMHGRGGIIEYVQRRLKESCHMVIVVAEGAGQELIAESLESQNKLSDASGNKLLLDVGLWLCQNLKDHFLKEFKEPLNLKYIDPTYMIRAIPSNASDNVYCTLLAHSAIHGAMAGYCGFTVGPVNNRHCYIPIRRVVATSRSVNVEDRMWARLMSSTNQPSFSHYKEKIEEQRKLHAEQRETRSREKNGSLTATGGNGKLSSTDEAVKHGEILETGNGQAMPQNTKEASFLTTTVPGDPTANADHHAP